MSTRKRTGPRPPRFDTRAFIRAHWVGAPALTAWLKTYHVDVQANAVWKWLSRNAIPAQFFPLILCLLEVEKGEAVSLVRFMKS